MRRELPTAVLIVLALALVGGAAWLTRHPDSAWLERAEGWPVVGRLAAGFRRAYLGEPAGEPGRAGGGGEGSRTVVLPAPPPAEESEATAEPAEPGPPLPAGEAGTIWAAPGDLVRARPAAGAAVVAEIADYRALLRLESRGDWHRVRVGGREGWLERRLPGPGEPPLPADTVPPRPLPGRRPDPERLAAAEALLGPAALASRLGPYPLLTDLPPARRGQLARLDRVAAAVEPAYRARYDRRPEGEPAETVVLFAEESGYRVFQRRDAALAGLASSGHTGYGLVALYDGGRRGDAIAATLIHELVHLLNRRGLGPALPPWLDEGLAVDLGLSEIGADGGLVPGRLGGAVVEDASRIELAGAPAALHNLRGAFERGELGPLDRLLALDWEGFVVSERIELHYAAAGFFFRYLLDPVSGLGDDTRGFFAAVAAGGPADAEALRARLGRSWPELEAGLRAWVVSHAPVLPGPAAAPAAPESGTG